MMKGMNLKQGNKPRKKPKFFNWNIYIDSEPGPLKFRDWENEPHAALIAELGSPGATSYDFCILLF